jgi:hypothetical protein
MLLARGRKKISTMNKITDVFLDKKIPTLAGGDK